MGRKGKTQKHTAKEIAAKTKAAKERNGAAGGGGDAKAKRLAVMNNQNVTCEICKQAAPNLASMTAHWDKKHSKVSKEIPPEYAMQYLALKEAKKKAQKLKGTSAAGAGKKVKKKKK